MEEFSVVIPTLDEARNIGKVIDKIGEHGDPEILVVDDGSRDRTRGIARERGARVIERNGENDLSKSIVKGIQEASNDRVVVMDGDGQHPPGKIPEVLEGLERNELFVVSRLDVEGRWRLHRRMMSVGSEVIVKAIFGSCRQVVDPISGFFGLRKEAVDTSRLEPRGYKALVEILVTHDLEVGETGYVFLQRENGDSSIGPSAVLDFLLHVVSLKYRQVKHSQRED